MSTESYILSNVFLMPAREFGKFPIRRHPIPGVLFENADIFRGHPEHDRGSVKIGKVLKAWNNDQGDVHGRVSFNRSLKSVQRLIESIDNKRPLPGFSANLDTTLRLVNGELEIVEVTKVNNVALLDIPASYRDLNGKAQSLDHIRLLESKNKQSRSDALRSLKWQIAKFASDPVIREAVCRSEGNSCLQLAMRRLCGYPSSPVKSTTIDELERHVRDIENSVR